MKQVLVLNADFNPISISPLSTCTWQVAITLVLQDKATALSYYEDTIRTVNKEYAMPSVIVMKAFKHFEHKAKFSKFNVKLRDDFKCQYCGYRFSHKSLTVDHVIPRAKGGKTSYDNLVAACKPCNTRKGHQTKLSPLRKPYVPTYYELARKMLKAEKEINSHWRPFLKLLED